MYGVGQNSLGQIVPISVAQEGEDNYFKQFTLVPVPIAPPYIQIDCGGEYSVIQNGIDNICLRLAAKEVTILGRVSGLAAYYMEGEKFDHFAAGFNSIVLLTASKQIWHITREKLEHVTLPSSITSIHHISKWSYGDWHHVMYCNHQLYGHCTNGTLGTRIDKHANWYILPPLNTHTCNVSQLWCSEKYTDVLLSTYFDFTHHFAEYSKEKHHLFSMLKQYLHHVHAFGNVVFVFK